MTLLETKLYVGDLPAEHLARPVLMARLRAGLWRRVTTITAPTGYGKSHALSELFSTLRRPCVRVSLDAGDDPTGAFWELVGRALDRLLDDEEGHEGDERHLPLGRGWLDALIPRLNRLGRLGSDRLLALDDVHALRDQDTLRSLEFFVDHLPSNLHVILSGRSLGPLPLARWRARNELSEIDPRELRFDLDETRSYLLARLGARPSDSRLSDDKIETLWRRCEGWPAVLHLAATSLERGPEARPDAAPEAAATLPGGQREVAELFADEVLGRLDTAMRRRIVGLSVLEACCLGLATATLGEELPNDWLAQLEAAHLPIVRLDSAGRWWRFHHLFADFLRRRSDPDTRLVAHLQASRWFEAAGDVEPAVHHALEAGDTERALKLLGSESEGLVESGRSLALLRAVGRLGVPYADLDTPLLDRLAWAAYMVHDDDRCRRAIARLELRDAAGDLDEHHAASLLALRATLARSRDGDLRRAIELFDAARIRLSSRGRGSGRNEGSPGSLAFAIAFQLAIAKTFIGDLDGAAQILEDLRLHVDPARPQTVSDLGVVSTLAQVRAAQGKLRVAETLCRRTLDAELARNPAGAPGHALLHRTLGRIHVQRGEWSAAEVQLARADVTSRQGGFEELQAFSALWRGEMARCRGESEAVDAAVHLVDRLAASAPLAPLHHAWQRALRLHRRLDEGDLAGAERLLRSVPPPSQRPPSQGLTYFDELWLQARIRALQTLGDEAQAQEELGDALEQARRQGRRELELELLAWRAWLSGRLAALSQALHAARDQGYVRPFLVLPRRDAARQLDRLLRRDSLAGGVRRLAERIQSELAARPEEPGDAASDLTEKEREVLVLVADGRTNQDIATDLGIAQTTVKTHVRHLFDKLGVRRRTQAVAEARAAGLL